MTDLRNLWNCSTTVDFLVKDFSDREVFKASKEILSESVQLNALTVAIITVIVNIVIHLSFCKGHAFSAYSVKVFNTKTIEKAVVIFCLLISLPIVITLVALALCYKVLCTVAIRQKDEQFVGLLDSFDVFWSLEDDATINVLGIIESHSPETLADNIRDKLLTVISESEVDKIFYRRYEEYGFYYWRKYNYIDVNDYIEVLDFPDKLELTVSDLEDIMSEVSYKSLPYDNKGLFKIFVTKQRISEQFESESQGSYGIIFIIHHSVGDGVALLEFLCKSFADIKECNPVNTFSVLPESRNYDSPGELLQMIKKLCEIPLCFVDTITRKPDKNSLHGPALLGQKSFKWTESDENLLLLVKEIKTNVENFTFSDILATALSGGVNNYFTKNKDCIPDDLGVILPVRFPKSSSISNNQLLKNDFSVTILNLPLHESIDVVKQQCDGLRKSADPLSNHYLIKLVSIFPKQILQAILNSNQATLVFSNMPGPDYLTLCGGNALKKLVFFVPHKGNTGLDVTALSYGGELRFAASADKALITNPEHISYILDGMVDEIKRLHQLYVRK